MLTDSKLFRVLFTLVLVVAKTSSAERPPWCSWDDPHGVLCNFYGGRGKFVAYSDSNHGWDSHQVVTEIIGFVRGMEGNELYIEPDQAYDDLLLPGNRHIPPPGDDSYGFWRDFVAPYQNVIKCEAGSGAGFRRHSPDSGHPAEAWDERLQQSIVVQRGMHVRIKGLYVVDYGHTPYFDRHSDAWCRMRGLYKACDSHAELHPYDPHPDGPRTSISVYYPNPPVACASTACANNQTLTIAAPRYPQVYSSTYWWNQRAGVDGHFVDDRDVWQPSVHAEKFVAAPPEPADCQGRCYLSWSSDLILEDGVGSSGRSVRIASPDGIYVNMWANGTDARLPRVRTEKFNIWWDRLSVSAVTPDRGPTAGGTPVTITGTSFEPGAMVRFGGIFASNVTVVNPTTITATTPAHWVGSVDVDVSFGGHTGSRANAFTYVLPPAQIMSVILNVLE